MWGCRSWSDLKWNWAKGIPQKKATNRSRALIQNQRDATWIQGLLVGPLGGNYFWRKDIFLAWAVSKIRPRYSSWLNSKMFEATELSFGYWLTRLWLRSRFVEGGPQKSNKCGNHVCENLGCTLLSQGHLRRIILAFHLFFYGTLSLLPVCLYCLCLLYTIMFFFVFLSPL